MVRMVVVEVVDQTSRAGWIPHRRMIAAVVVPNYYHHHHHDCRWSDSSTSLTFSLWQYWLNESFWYTWRMIAWWLLCSALRLVPISNVASFWIEVSHGIIKSWLNLLTWKGIKWRISHELSVTIRRDPKSENCFNQTHRWWKGTTLLRLLHPSSVWEFDIYISTTRFVSCCINISSFVIIVLYMCMIDSMRIRRNFSLENWMFRRGFTEWRLTPNITCIHTL